MTIDISNNDPRISYTVAAGVTQTSFAVPFEFFDDSDVNVYVNEVLKTITTDYTISGGDGSTGTVTISVTGPATVTLTRDITIERVTDFPTGIDINRAALNTQLDTLTAIAADLKDDVGLAIRVDDSDAGSNLILPNATGRANKTVSFDGSGNVLASVPFDLVEDEVTELVQATVIDAAATIGNAVVGANFINNTFTGNGTQTAFTTSTPAGSRNNAQVYIDGVYQIKSSYSVVGNTLTFSEAPPLNSSIEVIIGNALSTIAGDSSNVNYNQGGTGAQTRTVESKLQEFVSVKDFGAVGDGVADDTAAIQAALATGNNISLANGTYLVNDQLSATSSIIDGDFVLGSSVPSGYFLTFNASDIELRNVGFTANATPSNGATYFQTGSNISVQNCRFENFDRDGIAVSNLVTHIRIINNYLNNCKGDPAGAQFGSINCNASHSIIANNNIDYCRQVGISVNGVFKVVIQGNNINGRGLFVSGGVVVDGFCNFVSIDGNVIDDMIVEGINIAGSLAAYGGVSESISVTNNVCRKCYYTSLSLYSADANYSVRDVNVSGNTFFYEGGGTVGAVLLDGCKDVNLSANTIVGYPAAVNILSTGGNSPINTNIVGNTIKAQSSFGVFASNDMNIGSNIFIGSGGSTKAITGDAAAIGGKVLISNNFITGWGTGLDLTFTPTNTIYVRDNLLKNNTTDLDYTGAAGNSSLDNVFTDLVLSGTFTLSSGTATVANVNVQAGERIRLFRTTVGGTAGAAYVSQVNAGTQFIVTSTSATDTSTFSYEFVR